MHHIYHTEGLILGSRNYGETGKYYFLFTRDLGMIYASAQGVRKISSKLRFVLQDFSYVKIDLVRGKDFWRVTGASKTNKLENIIKNKETLFVFANISRLLKRLLPDEDTNTDLFVDLIKGLSVLEKAKDKHEIQNTEIFIVLRILNNLGYIGDSGNLEKLIKSPFAEELMSEIGKHRTRILSEINKALGETQL